MPEGHTLHRLALQHHKAYAGTPVRVSSPQGRFSADASLVDGSVLELAEAHGKHLFHVYGPDRVVHVHLGLYGTFTDGEPPAPDPVGQIRMRLVGGTQWTDLRGPTRCELLTDVEVDALRARLGPDPLRDDADPERVWARVSRSRAAVAVLLMDQSVIAGVGNVYRAELLFRHGIHPSVLGRDLDRALWDEMWPDLVALMELGVHRGRIDTVRDEHLPEATGRAPRQDRHGGEVYVYRRTGMPCLVCGTPIRTEVLAARNNYWCPTCQPAV
ncbi:Fpg/Nei family DNA glycosylase [Actinokineospora terrae]|uniref:Fpg/Nei family DNA glycosylase n=1 Tax=Actinokineospora terrae TaxID=155974 RepID=UPI000B8451C3|nr:zinc finger domain-containing protein [Actinokineospora terrae]